MCLLSADDAGDFIKHSLTIAQAALFLAWSAIDFPAGLAAAGQGRYAVREVVWAADYLTACHLAPYRYVGLIGDPGGHGFAERVCVQCKASSAVIG